MSAQPQQKTLMAAIQQGNLPGCMAATFPVMMIVPVVAEGLVLLALTSASPVAYAAWLLALSALCLDALHEHDRQTTRRTRVAD